MHDAKKKTVKIVVWETMVGESICRDNSKTSFQNQQPWRGVAEEQSDKKHAKYADFSFERCRAGFLSHPSATDQKPRQTDHLLVVFIPC